MLILGCHLSDKRGFTGMAEEAIEIGANTFQFFTRNPRGGHMKEWTEKDIAEYKELAKAHDFGQIVAYAPYTANPASADMQESDFARMVYSEDLARMQEIPGQLYVAHAGSAGETDAATAIKNAATVLNEVIQRAQETTFVVMTASGSGTEICSTFDELAQLLDQVKDKNVGVCFDTCTVYNAGYDIVNNLDGVLDEFDKKVGLDRIKVVHLADSKYGLGTKHETHAPLGEGEIGQEGLNAVIRNPRLAGKVFILETPHDDMIIFEHEIAKLKEAAQT